MTSGGTVGHGQGREGRADPGHRVRGFLPASLVDLRRVRDLHPFVGTELEAKIIELDRNRNNVVLSRRAFLEESQSEAWGFLSRCRRASAERAPCPRS